MKYINSILFILLIVNFLLSQDIDITYNKTTNIDFSKLLQDLPEDTRKIILASQETLEKYNVNFKLTGSNSYSDFRISEEQVNDMEDSAIKISNETHANVYQKKFSTSEVKFLLHRFNKTYLIEDCFPEFEWEIKNEQKIILGYKCIKAEIPNYFGRKVESWFAPKIPISNGPEEFLGLPGLILELSYGKRNYLAKSINIQPNVHYALNKKIDSKIKSTTFSQFMNYIKKEEGKLRKFNGQW